VRAKILIPYSPKEQQIADYIRSRLHHGEYVAVLLTGGKEKSRHRRYIDGCNNVAAVLRMVVRLDLVKDRTRSVDGAEDRSGEWREHGQGVEGPALGSVRAPNVISSCTPVRSFPCSHTRFFDI
jgi:hypothetical protein